MPRLHLPNIVLRILSALVLVPILVGAQYLGGVFWLALIAIITGLICFEWLSLIENNAPKANAFLFGLFFFAFAAMPSIPYYAVIFLGVPAAMAQDKNKALGVLTGPYIAFPMACIWIIGALSPLGMLWLAGVVWLTDTFALIYGKTFGGPKLAPSISPNKTWSGLLGGIFGAIVVTGAFKYFDPATPMALFGWAALISVVGQAGDLFESKYKRKFGVKDSGRMIPGHGGVLDRMDSFLFAAPVMWALLASGLITF